MSLRDDLEEISGVGPATSEEIVAVVDEHETDSDLRDAVKNALETLAAGQSDHAESLLRRGLE